MPKPVSKPTHGIIYILIATAFFCMMDAVAKWLVENAMHTLQILALRSIIIAPVLLVVYASKKQLTQLKPNRPIAHSIRGFCGFLAPLSFFIGIAYMPLTAAVVVFFSSTFLTTLLSSVFLNEKVGPHRWTAVFVGYIGVVIAIGPAFGGDPTGYLLVLFASLMYTVLFISGRRLSATESVASLVFSNNLLVGLFASFLLPWFWQNISLYAWLWVIVLSALALGGHFFITSAFSVAEASLIAPFEYTAIVWTILLDILIWQELPGMHTWFGAAVIISSGLYLLHRERVHSRKATA